jgi:hypothetical protein
MCEVGSLGPNPAVALLFKRLDELIASPMSCPKGRAQLSILQKAGDVYWGVGDYKYASQEFFTEAQCAELDQVRSGTRRGPMTLAYQVTIEDPTVWSRPWTVKQEFSRQSDEENRLYTEPRCIEGNQGLHRLDSAPTSSWHRQRVRRLGT